MRNETSHIAQSIHEYQEEPDKITHSVLQAYVFVNFYAV